MYVYKINLTTIIQMRQNKVLRMKYNIFSDKMPVFYLFMAVYQLNFIKFISVDQAF